MVDETVRRAQGQDGPGAADPADKVAQAIRTITANVGRTPGSGVAPTAAGFKAETRNTMLDSLVYGDNDLVGLIAYAMHEVNRRDWCSAYEAANGRPPAENELRAYLVGEQLERRLDTYRRLAEDSLAKTALGDPAFRRLSETSEPRPGPASAPVAALSASPAQSAAGPAPVKKKGRMGLLIIYLLMLLFAVVGVGYALRYGFDITSLGK